MCMHVRVFSSVLASPSAMSLVVKVANHNFLLANIFACKHVGHGCSKLPTHITEEGRLSLPTH